MFKSSGSTLQGSNNSWQPTNQKAMLRAIWSELRKLNLLIAEGLNVQMKYDSLNKDATTVGQDTDDGV